MVKYPRTGCRTRLNQQENFLLKLCGFRCPQVIIFSKNQFQLKKIILHTTKSFRTISLEGLFLILLILQANEKIQNVKSKNIFASTKIHSTFSIDIKNIITNICISFLVSSHIK